MRGSGFGPNLSPVCLTMVSEDACAPQVHGVSGIEPLLGSDHQGPAIGCALGQNLSRQFETFGERRRKISDPRNVEL